MRTLVAYASKHGSTWEVAEAIAAALRERGLEADLYDAAQAPSSLEGYDAVVLGSSIYMGRLHADARRFIKRNHEALRERRVAIFALGYLEESQRASSEMQLRKALESLPDVEPDQVTVFGGRIDPSQLHFPFSKMPAQDARDWDEIDRFAADFAGSVPTPA